MRRGFGRYCSLSCAARSAHRSSQVGAANHNWRGGVSRDHTRYVLRFRARHPKKYAAHLAVRAALKRGVLVRPDHCECGWVGKPEAHHDDYTKPLIVRWLCRTCHVVADRLRREGNIHVA